MIDWRIVAGKIRTVVGDLATQAEKLQSLLSWRDPMATTRSVRDFLSDCCYCSVCYTIPSFGPSLLSGFYILRHPRFRGNIPCSVPLNFFRRFPATTDNMALSALALNSPFSRPIYSVEKMEKQTALKCRVCEL